VLTLALPQAALFARFVRAATLETLAEPFVRTARSLGVGPGRLLLRHVLRHALLPVVTVVALHAGALFSGALVVETVFARLGMGRLIYDAVLGSDYNLALAGLTLATAVTLLCTWRRSWLPPLDARCVSTRTPDRRPNIPAHGLSLAPADQHLVGGGFEGETEAEQAAERGVRGPTAVEAEDELVEVGLEVLRP
jgi:hypothetical protein